MRLMLKHKIIGLSIMAALLPVIVILVTILVQKDRVDQQVGVELDILARENVARVAQDVYAMCESVDLVMQQNGQTEFDPYEITALREAIYSIVVGKTGYVFILGGEGADRGNYIISKNGTRDGENIWGAQDSDGNLFIQQLVNQAVRLNGNNVDFIRYPWLNTGERVARYKVSALAYYEPWDWVIGAGTYEDDFYEARNQVGSALNQMILISLIFGLIILATASILAFVIGNTIANPIAKISSIAGDIAKGDLDQSVDIHTQDEVGMLAEAFRDMIESLRQKAAVAESIAMGDLTADVQIASNRDVLGKAMSKMKDSLTSMLGTLKSTIEEQKAGNFDALTNPKGFEGAYAELLQGMNDALNSVIDPLKEVIEILQEYARGDLSKQIRNLPGKQIALTNSLNEIRSNLNLLINEGRMLAKAGEEGRLKTRGDASKFEGGYRDIIDGMNNIIENILAPVNETVGCLEKMAKGNLTVAVAGDYKGDHAVMKNSMNETLDSLNNLLGQVSVAIDQVNSGSGQVSDSSQALSQGATEQASSLEEITSSMTEMGAQTKQNAENATKANGLATDARNSAEGGNQQMQRMLESMGEINDSSNEISKIIKVIDEIAFQTNLLALNAAVEAARAGVHGKGFAVVAEEVRNLAQRSAKAAGETTEMIEESIKKVEKGTQIANDTASALDEIVNNVTKATDLVAEIASASNEQALGISQVNEALQQIDSVTQSNSANAEESASAAEELSSQADELRSLISRFALRHDAQYKVVDTSRSMARAPKLKPAPVEGWGEDIPERKGGEVKTPKDIISLEDDDFEGF